MLHGFISDITGTYQPVTSSSPDGASKFKRMPSELQFQGSRAHRVAQILWSTGMLDEPITSGFYSILPVSHANLIKIRV